MSQRFTDTFDAKPLSNYEQKAILALELISPGLSRQDMADVVNHASPRVETDEACHTPVEFVEALWTAYTGRLELDEYCMRRTLAEDVDETAMQDLIETVESVAMVLQEFGMPFRSTTDEIDLHTIPHCRHARSTWRFTPEREYVLFLARRKYGLDWIRCAAVVARACAEGDIPPCHNLYCDGFVDRLQSYFETKLAGITTPLWQPQHHAAEDLRWAEADKKVVEAAASLCVCL